MLPSHLCKPCSLQAVGRKSVRPEAERFQQPSQNDGPAGPLINHLNRGSWKLAIPGTGPIYGPFRQSCPPFGERTDFASNRRPWEAGEPIRHGRFPRKAGERAVSVPR